MFNRNFHYRLICEARVFDSLESELIRDSLILSGVQRLDPAATDLQDVAIGDCIADFIKWNDRLSLYFK